MTAPAACLVAAASGPIQSFSSRSRVDQVRPLLDRLLESGGVRAGEIDEMHWHGGDEEFWLAALGRAAGFSPAFARFNWPAYVLLPHAMLQGISRALESEKRRLVIQVQESAEQAVALLLASSPAVEQLHLVPRIRFGERLALSSGPDGLISAAAKVFKETGVEAGRRKIQWLAAPRQAGQPGEVFPGSRWLDLETGAPSGDLFLLASLASRLVETQADRGLLISEGPQKSGLVTLVERA